MATRWETKPSTVVVVVGVVKVVNVRQRWRVTVGGQRTVPELVLCMYCSINRFRARANKQCRQLCFAWEPNAGGGLIPADT